ncbi:Oxo-4-hydroxy-4-carboxy-5-ureidoimidazoline decarboxylase [Scheffersomyces xylosifermentans]|uniref:Oxo-4-hydroxy-4-carboxy-5-ureidoimidazoline decarboxylase n=1 Tax=Scheffersomyces xylosifermentans TaxID=1304137 RepID=UPI00315C5E72
MSYTLPPVNLLSKLSREEQTEILGHLFEPCETLSSFIVESVIEKDSHHKTYKQFIETVRKELLEYLKNAENESYRSNAPIDPKISKIIAAHPRLGGSSKTTNVKLSQHSSAEQKSLESSSKEDAEKLIQLNDLYESTFPGLRYVVFVNGRSRPVVMQNMKERIDRNDIHLERVESFEAMCDIALDRARKLGGSENL